MKDAVFLSLVHGTASEPARRLVKCADSRALLQNGLNQHRSGEGKNSHGQKDCSSGDTWCARTANV